MEDREKIKEFLEDTPELKLSKYTMPYNFDQFKDAIDTIKTNAEELRSIIWEVRKRINDIQSYMLEYELMQDYNIDTETKMYIMFGELVDFQDYLKDIFDKYPNINTEVDNDNNNNN